MGELVDKAIIYATEKHSGQVRKFSGIPYILHPMEVAAIISTMTNDEEIIAAGLLHDTIEDCDADPLEIEQIFGKHVAALVSSETEDKLEQRPPEETWQQRKADSLLLLQNSKNIDVKIMWLADKLSNIRSFSREYRTKGDEMWKVLHQKDKKMQEWYYREIAKCLPELSDTAAYIEFTYLIDYIFGD